MAFSVVEEAKKRRKVSDPGSGDEVSAAPRSGGFDVARAATERRLKSGGAQEYDNAYRSWLDEADKLGSRLSSEYGQREGKYQSASDFSRYRSQASSEIADLLKRAYQSRDYYSQYGNLYGEGEKERITGDIDKAIQYLNDLRGGLAQEESYWKQFKDEADYTQQIAAWEQEKKDEEYYSVYDVDAGKAQLEKVKNDLLSISAEYNEAAGFGGTNKVLGMDDIPSEEEIREQQSGIRARHEALAAEQEKLEREIKEAEYRQTRNRYGALAQNTDFDALSKQDLSVDDALYRHLNGEEVTLHELRRENKRPGDYEELGFMDEKELGVYNYLYRKEGKAAADEYLDWLGQDLSRRRYDKAMQESYNFGKEHKILGSILSVPENLAGGVISLADRAVSDMIGKEFDPYSRAQQMGASTEQTRAGASSDLGDVGKFLYNTVMSGADSLAAGKLLPGSFAPGMVLAAGAASSGARDIAQRGGTQEQQLAGGLAAGLFEMLFEAWSIGNLKSMKEVPVSGLKDFLLNMVKSAGVNASEEALTELANIIYDTAAMGDISNWNLAIAAYEAQDIAPEDAKMQVIKDMAWQVAQAAGSGALMGIGFGGIGTAQSLWNNPGTLGMGKQGRQIQKQGGYNALLDEALKLDFDTPAYQMALQMRDGTMEANDLNIGRLATAVERQNAKNAAFGAPPEQLKAYAEVFRSAKKTMGQRGAAAIAENTDLTKNAPEYFKDFARVYNEGQKGERSNDLGSLSREQYTAAFEAGQADAKAGDTDGTVVQVAKDAGVDWEDDYVKGMDQEVAKRIDQLGKDLGVRVRFVDVVRPVKGKNGIVGTADGQYEGNEILVEKNNPNPELFIVGHEFAHRMQDLSPETYNSFVQAVLEDKAYFARGGTGTVEGAITAKIAQYKLKGEALTRETAIDELVADYAGHLLTNETYLDSFMESHKENRTMLEKLRDLFHEFSLTIKGALGNKAAIAERKLTQMLESSKQSAQEIREGKVQKNTATEGGGVRYALQEISGRIMPVIDTKNDTRNFAVAERYLQTLVDLENPFATILADAQEVYIGRDLPGEYRSSENSKSLGGALRTVKMQAATNLDEMLLIGTNGRWQENIKEKHKVDAQNGWYRYDTEFAVPILRYTEFDHYNIYKAVLLIRNDADGKSYLYDLVDIEEKEKIFNSASRQSEVNESRSSPTDSIPANSPKSNTQNSASKNSLKTDTDLDDEINAIYQRGHAEGWTEEEMRDEVDLLVEQRLQEARDKYGVIPAGENPARDVQVPKRTADNQKVSQTVRTILEAKTTPDAAVPTIEELTANGDFSYEVYTDKQAMADAENTIRDKGYNSALMDWTKSVQEGEVSKSNTALGWALYNQAANAGDLKTAMSILTNMVGHQRNAAQAVQATRILKKMSPEAQLYGVQRSAQNLAEELEKRYGKDAPDIQVNEDLARKYLEAETDKEREEAMRNLYRDLGRQMPSRFIDKWNAWRYLAMLGNPRTHVRNVLGNAFFAPVVATKNMTATAIEAAVSRVSGGKIDRTKGTVGFDRKSRDLLSAAWSDYESVADQVSSGGKYSDLDHSNQYIQEGRRIFKNRALEAARKGNSAALEAEDMWFSRPHYAYALAQYCKANGITAEQMRNGKGLDRARAYAIKEAQKATYRDTNAFSQTISELGRYRGNNKVKKGVGVALEGILPFRKTPANILVRGLEYSPLGLANGIKQAVLDVKRGTKTAAEAIDSVSAGLTGTGLLALGAFLAAQGLVRGSGGDDEDKNEFEEMQGHQAYALELPDGTSVTLDWLAPEVLPFFVGVNLWEQAASKDDGGVTMSDILTATANVTEPLLEMSCLQSLNDVFDAVGYASSDGLSALPSALASAATSYLTQGFPTILGQAERTGEDKRMTTYTEKNAFLTADMQYTVGRISARLPGWDYQQIPYIDAWGRTENTGNAAERAGNNFLNPAYTSTAETSPMEDELLRLYEQTGDGGVLPSRAAKYFNVDGERKDLTAQEYVKYATAKGQTAYKVLTALSGSEAYRKMSDAEKVEAVGLVYEYANATAKTKVSGYKPEGWIAKAVKTEKATGVKAEQYVTLYLAQKGIESLKEADGDTIANSKSLLVMEMVYNVKGLTDAQRRALFEDFGVGKTVIHWNKALVQEQLKAMRKKAA